MTSPVAEALAYVAAAYSTFKLTDAVAMVWDDLLGHYPRETLIPAVRGACRTHTFGAPAPSHVIEQIEGRIETVRVPVMVWPTGPQIFDDTGKPVYGPEPAKHADGTPLMRSEQRRVFPDGRTEPLALPKHEDNDGDWRDGPGSLADGLAALGLGEGDE